jgi:hypothetical protein
MPSNSKANPANNQGGRPRGPKKRSRIDLPGGDQLRRPSSRTTATPARRVDAMRDFEKSTDELASSPASQNLKFEREDWTLFRTLDGLQQRAGVVKDKLSRLVLKELTDNGLDEGARVRIGSLPNLKGGYFVEDDGSGIDGTSEEIAQLFSIRRQLQSTKLLRLPRRGALGNGLRVVAGSVLVSKGSLVVVTRNRRIVLRPERDGSTTVVSVKAVDFPVGTRIEISFGPALPCDANTMCLARIACRMMVRSGPTYSGRSSPWWYDAAQFHEVLDASGARPVRDLIANLDGCTGAKAGEIVAAARLGRAICNDVTFSQAERLLIAARENAKQVTHDRLGAVGQKLYDGAGYACAHGIAKFGSAAPFAEVPFVVEVWAMENDWG